MRIFLWSSVVVFSLARTGIAAPLLQEEFDYTNGPLVVVSGGRWMHHSGTITGEVSVVSGQVQLDAGETEDVNATVPGQPYPPTGLTNIFYAGFTVRFTALPSATGTYFAHFKDSSATGFRARVWALTSSAASGKFRIGLSSTGGSSAAATNTMDLNLNTDYLIVTRLNCSNSFSKLWINPTAESDPAIITAESPSAFTVVSYAFRQNTGEGILNVDDLRIGTRFTDIITNAPPLEPPEIIAPPQNESAVEHQSAPFTVAATGSLPLSYQWRFNGTNLSGATNEILSITNVSFTHAGFYSVLVSNALDVVASEPVALNVFASLPPAIRLLTYNLHGNGALNWSTNTAHVQAIGRQIRFLDPDIMTFQEVPVTNNGTAQMANFVAAFRPGFYLATNSADDLFIRSVILSRFPIVASRSWLHSSDLTPFGYSLSGFTRDLFEAEISVPGFAQPLHVFTVHLKSGQDNDSSAKRGAEAGAISNFFAADFLTTNSLQPYILTGDMNEDILQPPPNDPQSIQRLTAAASGLHLMTPFNLFDNDERTFSIQSSNGLSRRYDYVLPCGLLFSNLVGCDVFRTDLLDPTPPNLNSNDDRIASDHLPVLAIFANPYNQPFRLLSIDESNQSVTLSWDSVPGQTYVIERSTNLVSWETAASNLLSVNSTSSFTTNGAGRVQFFRIRRGQ